MDDRVLVGWQAWNSPFEGTVHTFYNDILGLTTIGVGNLCNTVREAMALPMVHISNGFPATPEEIAQEWHRVHDDPTFAKLGWKAAAKGASLEITDEGLAALVRGKLLQMEGFLAHRFPEWNAWPWQAQQAALSMSWAAGPALVAPHWEAACKAQDWATAALQCHLDDSHNPGLRPRNAANRALYLELGDTQSPAPADTPASETNASETLEGPTCH